MIKILLAGAAPDTGNMGVSALLYSAIHGIKKHIPDARISVLDNGEGIRNSKFNLGELGEVSIELIGVRVGRRYSYPGNFRSLLFLTYLGEIGSFFNFILQKIEECDVVVDVSGGDSFSDIYGSTRFFSIVAPKLIALKKNIPLVLLPQTYGPYNKKRHLKIATRAIEGATLAWARDERSFVLLKTILGESFDSQRHFSGVDIAFSLPEKYPQDKLPNKIETCLMDKSGTVPLVGINISGLVFNNPEMSKVRFKFITDYVELTNRFVAWLLEDTNACVFLVPHVMNPEGHYESDYWAAQKLSEGFLPKFFNRLHLIPNTLDALEVKGVISRLDWFSGMRMHSTIAGLSSGVPTSSVAYSDKTKGVFETCDQGHEVFDPRDLTINEIFEKLKQSFLSREQTKCALEESIPRILKKSSGQFFTISQYIKAIP